ncbi:MAG TPA: hypothetical protein VJ997_05725, partial [Longimicrobiales bacterium]|nr:hypothetical protein [Longimicrobiales bacterium]
TVAAHDVFWYGGWSPDGEMVCFSTNSTDIEIAAPDGGRRRTILASTQLGNARWRPDGEAVGLSPWTGLEPLPAPAAVVEGADRDVQCRQTTVSTSETQRITVQCGGESIRG